MGVLDTELDGRKVFVFYEDLHHTGWTIGFVVPNSDCKGSMFRYACSVDQVEALTGHDFFYELPDSIENKIEAAWGTQADWQ